MAFQRRKPAAIGVNAPYPGFVEPALATSVDKVPSGDQWLHQIKFDGYRVQVQLRDAAVKLFTRRGNGWTNRFRKIAADACHMNAGPAIIDGEVVVPSADGTTDFSILQNELKGRSKKIVMVAFLAPTPKRLYGYAGASKPTEIIPWRISSSPQHWRCSARWKRRGLPCGRGLRLIQLSPFAACEASQGVTIRPSVLEANAYVRFAHGRDARRMICS